MVVEMNVDNFGRVYYHVLHRLRQYKLGFTQFVTIYIRFYTGCNKRSSGNISRSFRFLFEKREGRGSRTSGNTKPEEKLHENRGAGLKLNLRKTFFLYNLRYFCRVSKW